MSNITAPLYLYATLKGKFTLWDALIANIPDDLLRQPTLDVGCGRGLVLLKMALGKKRIGSGLNTAKSYGIDLFIQGDQSGNAPEVTFDNAAALGLLDMVALHTASMTEILPFQDNSFGVVTASLSVHNVNTEGRRKTMKEIVRVCQAGGKVIMVDLAGYVKGYQAELLAAGWTDVEVGFGGARVMFGLWPCQVLNATKPSS
jgi:ubiquinone/menaquinone biosynthesis C-methylase UbiE